MHSPPFPRDFVPDSHGILPLPWPLPVKFPVDIFFLGEAAGVYTVEEAITDGTPD